MVERLVLMGSYLTELCCNLAISRCTHLSAQYRKKTVSAWNCSLQGPWIIVSIWVMSRMSLSTTSEVPPSSLIFQEKEDASTADISITWHLTVQQARWINALKVKRKIVAFFFMLRWIIWKTHWAVEGTFAPTIPFKSSPVFWHQNYLADFHQECPEHNHYLSCSHPAAETHQHHRSWQSQSRPWSQHYMTSCRRAAASSHCEDTVDRNKAFRILKA